MKIRSETILFSKKLKIEAENLLEEHKAKEKKNTMYIDELKKQTRREPACDL